MRSLIFIGLLSDLLSFSVFFSLLSEPELDFPAAAAACIAKNLSMKLPSLEKNSGLGVAFSFSASLAAFGFFIHEGNPAFFTTVELLGMSGCGGAPAVFP